MLLATVGEEAVVADALEAVGENMEEEAADELVGLEGDVLCLVVVLAVFVVEGDLAVADVENAVVGYGNAVGVPGQVVNNGLWAREWGTAVTPMSPPLLWAK